MQSEREEMSLDKHITPGQIVDAATHDQIIDESELVGLTQRIREHIDRDMGVIANKMIWHMLGFEGEMPEGTEFTYNGSYLEPEEYYAVRADRLETALHNILLIEAEGLSPSDTWKAIREIASGALEDEPEGAENLPKED
jgi:hypothetical protein